MTCINQGKKIKNQKLEDLFPEMQSEDTEYFKKKSP